MKKKTLIISVTSIILIIATIAIALHVKSSNEAKEETVTKSIQSKNKVEAKEINSPIISETEVEEIAPVESEIKSQTFVEPPVTVQKETLQEVALKYLDLSGVNQTYFDNIVATYPEYFTEENRESNIKALRVYYSLESTGMHTPGDPMSLIVRSFPGSNFFESDLSKVTR